MAPLLLQLQHHIRQVLNLTICPRPPVADVPFLAEDTSQFAVA
jgi:hypothetical protein